MSSQAYRVDEPAAYRVTDTHVLYSIPFNAGFLNRTSLTPLFATTNAMAKNAVIVSVRDDKGALLAVPLRAIVLAPELTHTNGYYVVPQGTRGEFELIAVAAIPKGTTTYHLNVERLPYLLIDSEKKMTATTVESPFIEAFVTPAIR